MRKNALDRLINDCLLEQAAKRAHLTPEQYVKREIHPAKKTEADAKKFYNDNKHRFGTATFDQVKMRLILALQQSEDNQ